MGASSREYPADQGKGKQRLQVLYRKHREAIRTKLRVSGVVGADIDELFQSVFSIAVRRVAMVPVDEDEAKYWLLDVARKQAANFHRLYRHAYEVVDTEVVEGAAADPDEDTEEVFAQRDLVRETTARLSPEDKEILLRHDVAGETLAELAKWLKLTKSGAHARLELARHRFAEAFEMVQEERELGVLPLLLAVWQGVRAFFSTSVRDVEWGELWLGRRWLRKLKTFLGDGFRLGLGPMVMGPVTAVLLFAITPRVAADGRNKEAPSNGDGRPGRLSPQDTEQPISVEAGKSDVDVVGPGTGFLEIPDAGIPDPDLDAYNHILGMGPRAEKLHHITLYLETYPHGRFRKKLQVLERRLRAEEQPKKSTSDVGPKKR